MSAFRAVELFAIAAHVRAVALFCVKVEAVQITYIRQ
jgi:hypothetical protein